MRMGRADKKSFERLDILTVELSGVTQELAFPRPSYAAGNRSTVEDLGVRQNKEKYLVAARFELARVFPTGSQVK